MNARFEAQRSLKAAIDGIDRTGTHLNNVVEVYQTAHPEISEPLVVCMQYLQVVQDGIRQVLEGI